MTVWAFVLLGCYVSLVVLVVVRMRQMGAGLFDLFVFAVNTGAITWLLFLYMLWSDERAAAPHDSWIPLFSLLLSVLLIPSTIRGAVLAVRPQANGLTPEERAATLRALGRQYPTTAVELIIGTFWLIFLGGKTFGYDRSHMWPILLGIGASAGLGWIVVVLIRRWLHNDAT